MSLPKNYIDIQHHASKYFKNPKGSRIGLKNSVELLNIQTKGEFHDALNDAYYTSKVFKAIYNPSIEAKPYNFIPHTKRKSEPKEVVDNDALIGQFEKMYNRKMSVQEKKIIHLAYIMGKTNQFLK